MAGIKIQSALIMSDRGTAEVVHDLTIPSPEYNQVLVKISHVALNTPDVLALDYLGRPGAGLGFDFSGEVVEIGEGVPNHWKIHDRVAGFVHACHGANYSIGAFRGFVLADADLLIRIPLGLSFCRASTLGMGVSTAGQALYQSLSLPLPDGRPKTERQTVLIYGASSATGAIAVQLAKLSGLRVIATCSKSNISWIRSLGADEVIDYKESEAISKIQSAGRKDGIFQILDCISSEQTARFCYQCFIKPTNTSSESLKYTYASLMPVEGLPALAEQVHKNVQNTMNMVYTCFGRRFTIVNKQLNIEKTWPPSKEDRDFMVSLYRLVENHLADATLQPMPIDLRQEGLNEILNGIAEIRDGHVHGRKLVYNI